METRRNLRQETIRPQLFFKVLSKEIINPFHLPRLRTDNFVQIQSIKTSSNQHLYEEKMPVLKSKIFSITIFFIEKVFYVELQPQSQKFQQATHTQKLLKGMPPYIV